MKENNKIKIILASISAVTAILGIGYNIYFDSQVANIKGDNNNVTINNVNDLFKEYQNLLDKYEILEKQNQQYFLDYKDAKKQGDDLKKQFNNSSDVKFEDLGLCINGEDISVNSSNSKITIDGREYYSKDLAVHFLPEDSNLTTKDSKLYIGKIVENQTNLIDLKVNDKSGSEISQSRTDSYGNMYSNCLYLYGTKSNMIFVTGRKFSLFQFTIAIPEDANTDRNGIVTVKADDNIVYTSPSINKQTEPFVTPEIAINNCTLLTIEYSASQYNNCIISKATVYN